jgi:molecular chaperone GrpE
MSDQPSHAHASATAFATATTGAADALAKTHATAASDTVSQTAPTADALAQAQADWAQAQSELAALQAQNAELLDQHLRAKAEVENVRRRTEDDMVKVRKFAVESFAESLLPALDSLEAGLAIQDASVAQIREGAQATLRQLLSALERNKVLAINPAVGDKFDPHQHQAISVVPAEQAANTVVSVLQKGYSLADRVLRPALVTVSGPAP